MNESPAEFASPAGKDLAAASHGFPPPKVMMIDDEKLNSLVVGEYLKAAGFRDLAFTTDPLEALPLARRVRPDVILLDLQMPKLSGFEVLRQLRADDAFSRTAIVMLTASTDDKEKSRARELGATDFFSKPVERNQLLAGLRAVLASQAYQDQHRAFSAELTEQATA